MKKTFTPDTQAIPPAHAAIDRPKEDLYRRQALASDVAQFHNAVNAVLLRASTHGEPKLIGTNPNAHHPNNMLADIFCRMLEVASGEQVEHPNINPVSPEQNDTRYTVDGRTLLFNCGSGIYYSPNDIAKRRKITHAALVLAESLGIPYQRTGRWQDAAVHPAIKPTVTFDALAAYQLLKPVLDAAPEDKQQMIDALWAGREQAASVTDTLVNGATHKNGAANGRLPGSR